MKADKKHLTPKSQDLSKWYHDVILQAELADYGPAKGTMVIRPYGYALWERVQQVFDAWIKEYGVDNAYFPLFIPQSLLEKEQQHVEGFAPELAVVTHGGGKKLRDPLIIRPTSETIMYHMFAKWIESWRDLPMMINQWNNVVRWEMRTYLFLRTTEFLWQEGHTAHPDFDSADDMQRQALEWYRRLYEEYYAIPVLSGVKSASETFAGADSTFTVELLMPDGKALQGATSHNLGQGFAEAFDIAFQDQAGQTQRPWQTSWGLSTRSLGGLFMAHGDDQGLVLPPRLAPTTAVVIPILGKQDDQVITFCQDVAAQLAASNDYPGKIEVWDQPHHQFGWKMNQAELRGVPGVIAVGPQEVAANQVTIKPRPAGMEQRSVSVDQLKADFGSLLDEIQQSLLAAARDHLRTNTHTAETWEEFKTIMTERRGFIWALWCESEACEQAIQNETKATTRLKPLDDPTEQGSCVYCGQPAKYTWLFAQAY